MKHLRNAILALVALAAIALATSVHNSRVVPDTLDWTTHGNHHLRKSQFLLLKDLANILPSTAGGDGINVDSIRGNPDVDSLGGSILIDTLVGQRAGGVIVNDSLKVVNSLTVSEIRGNPDVDSLGGSILIDTLVGQRAGGVIVNDSLKVVNSLTVSGNASIAGVTLCRTQFDSILTNTDGSETITAAQSGALFVATKSDGATTFTLPDASSATVGCVWTFIQTANQNLVVTAATADNNAFVADAVATSDQVSCATGSHLIGSGIVVYGISATQYAAFELNAECPLTVEAAD